MRYLIQILLLSSVLLANENYNSEQKGKIDMHGGKSTKLVQGSRLNNTSMKSLNNSFIKTIIPLKDMKKEEKEKNTNE